MSNHVQKPRLVELKVAGEISDVQWTILLTASVAGLFMAMATLQDREALPLCAFTCYDLNLLDTA